MSQNRNNHRVRRGQQLEPANTHTPLPQPEITFVPFTPSPSYTPVVLNNVLLPGMQGDVRAAPCLQGMNPYGNTANTNVAGQPQYYPEPPIIGDNQKSFEDRSQELSRTYNVQPPPVPSQPSQGHDAFLSQLSTVAQLIQVNNITELYRPGFQEHAMSLYDKAREEFEADPPQYDRKYRKLMSVIAYYMQGRFGVKILEYKDIVN